MNIALSPEADYGSVTAPGCVRIQRLLPGPIERIWGYLTDSELRRQWLAAGDMPAQAGGEFELVWRNNELTDPPGQRPDKFGDEIRMHSRVVEFEPPRRLVFTWSENGLVSMELEPRGSQVMLTVLHERISDRANLLMIGAGWHMHLNVLEARARGEIPSSPFWDGWSRLRDEYDRRIPA